ncbi:unnamed protein product [Dibothriocephalus latus]|uniref:Uncharacterized protein n=1 Tax=Dibothriocephalus latus TaxID=60516 RepID=A0A3P7QK40_DIBLA|nr:unnamed protein product [Dibothriocephalus latus]
MAKREYVYARRWWTEMQSPNLAKIQSTPTRDSSSGGLALIVSRAVGQPSEEVQKQDSSAQSVENSWFSSSAAGSTVVSVSNYESNMLIRSHGRFDEVGLDYFLTYSDDPKLSVSQDTFTRRIKHPSKTCWVPQFHLLRLFFMGDLVLILSGHGYCI